MAGLVGLRYEGVKSLADAMEIPWTEDTIRRISYLEHETLNDFHKKTK